MNINCRAGERYRALLGLEWEYARKLLREWSLSYQVRSLRGIDSHYDLTHRQKVFWVSESDSGAQLEILLASPQRESGEVLHAKDEIDN